MMFLLIPGDTLCPFFCARQGKASDQAHCHDADSCLTNIFWDTRCVRLFYDCHTPVFWLLWLQSLIGIDIGFSLPVYAGLIGILALLSTAFALFLNSFFDVADTANMLGSAIIILTSILAGSFYSLSKEASLLDKFLLLLPQKDFINFVNALEKGSLSQADQDISWLIWSFYR